MSPTTPLPCRAPRRGRLLLVSGFTVPVIVFGSLIAASPAMADTGVSTKTELASAFAAAPDDGTTTTVSVTAPLTGDDDALDALVVPHGANVVLQLNGNEVDLDSLSIENAAHLTVQDTGSDAPGLRVGTTASRDASSTDDAGIVLATSTLLDLESAHVEAQGSDGRAGIGQLAGTTNATFSVNSGSVVASGGAGAAGIGGGRGSDALALVDLTNSDVTASEGASTAGSVAASAVGHGQGPATTSGDVQLSSSTLHIPAGSTYDVADGASLSVDYYSVVDVAGTLSGAGTVSNEGSLVPAGSGTIDPDLSVSGNDYEVTFDANGGTTTAPATKHIYAPTLAQGGFKLSETTGASGDESLVGWTNPYYGGWWWGSNRQYVDQISLSNLKYYSQAYENSQYLTFTAQYEHPITFTSGTLPKATLGTKFDQKLPVTGDATYFYSPSNYDDGEGGLELLSDGSGSTDSTLTGMPAGLQMDSATGEVSGYPAEPGHYEFLVNAYSQFQFKQQRFSIDVAGAPVFATSDLPGGTAGSGYSTPIVAVGDGDKGSTSYAVSGGALPAGMTLSSIGVLSGTPKAAGSYTFGVKATNDYGSSKTAFTLLVGAGASAAAPATSAAPAASAPVLPVVAPAEVKLGSQFQLSVAANSTEAVVYSVPDGELPEGLSLDAKTGLITGVPRQSGHFVVHVTAQSASGTTLRAYSIDVPQPTKRVTGNINRVTPKSGQAVKVAIHGLKAGERWTVFIDGKPTQTGKARFGGTVFRTVKLAKAAKDTEHVITVAGSKTSADPSVLSSARLHVTVVAAKKALKLSHHGSAFTVTGLAAKEKITVKQGGKTIASGRADADGTFAFTRTGLKAGKHVLKATGSTTGRVDLLTFTVKR